MTIRKLQATMNDPDAALMIRFQNGDEHAFQELYQRYKNKIINYCYRFIGDKAVSEELAQEVLIRVYRAAANYRRKARFSTWIFKIATNVCLKEVQKKEYRTPRVSMNVTSFGREEEQEMELPDTRTPGPDKVLERQEKVELIRRVISTLPSHQRAALLLSTFENFSYAQIAEQIGKSKSSVKALIHRARRQLAAEIKKE